MNGEYESASGMESRDSPVFEALGAEARVTQRGEATEGDTALQPDSSSGFVWTGVAIRIRNVASYLISTRSMGVLIGRPGIGKTMALRAVAEHFPGAIFTSVGESTVPPNAYMKELATLLRLPTGRQLHTTFRLVRDALKGSQRLLIVDEAHWGKVRLLNVVRNLHDEAGIPVLLAGMPQLVKLLLKGREDDSIEASLYSRIAFCCDLNEAAGGDGGRGKPLYTTDDLKRLFAADQLVIHADAMQWLTRVANESDEGHLRLVMNLVRMATRVARRGEDRSISLGVLTEAARFLLGSERLQALPSRVETQKKGVA